MALKDIELPSPAWKLKEILRGGGGISTLHQEGPGLVTFVIFTYATFRTNENLWLYKSRTGGAAPYTAFLRQSRTDNDVTKRLTQKRWDEIYCKVMAAVALMPGKLPNIIEEIF